MKLWIMRHGEAEPTAARDSERALTAHGRTEVQRMAGLFDPANLPFDTILASPYVRAQQTAEIVRQAVRFRGPVITAAWLTPDDSPRTVIEFLGERSEKGLLLVSHQPLVGQLIGLLVEGHRQAAVPLPTAGVACLDTDFLAAGIARLEGLWTPADLMG